MPKVSLEAKREAYYRLMAEIFKYERDPQIPLCYPYIIKEGEKISLEEGVKRVLETLPDPRVQPRTGIHWTRENKVKLLNLRFGLEDGNSRSLKEIAREFGVTDERIRQMKVKTLRLLRHPQRSEKLRAFLIPSPQEKEEWESTKAEIEKLREAVQFLSRFGLSVEDFDQERMKFTRDILWAALQKVASFYPGIRPHLVSRAYNGLMRAGINSLAQLKAIINIDESRIANLRDIGEKSFWLIKKAIEIADEETQQ